jgi:hypothetical protein
MNNARGAEAMRAAHGRDLGGIIVMVFGCFLLIGTVMGLISILLIGPGRVAPARTALTLALSAAVGIGLVMMGTAVRRGSDAARWGSLACLVLLVSGSAVLVVAGVRQDQGDGAGYLILGALQFVALSIAGIVFLIRAKPGVNADRRGLVHERPDLDA